MDTHRKAAELTNDHFSREIKGLAAAVSTQTIDLADGDTYDLISAPVRKHIGGAEVAMLAYNRSVPGPTLRVLQDSSLTVRFVNQTDLANTVHWHGLRLENRSDGTLETQAPVPTGRTFVYQLRFPDPGIYWYHPHVREDYSQEMGLYGNILVVPSDSDYWPPAHREVVLTLDDILIEDDKVAPFSRSETTFAAMGRYGNVLLAGGETNLALTAQRDEIVRFYLTNTANTRVFNVALPGAQIKLIGGDSGRYEREEFLDSVILAPSERAVIDVRFEQPGRLTLEHRTPARTYSLASVTVSAGEATPSLVAQFEDLRRNPEWIAERRRIAPYLEAPADKTLAFVAEMDMSMPEGPVVYACPMHPEVVSDDPGRCPKCGMQLIPTAAPSTYVCPMHPEVISDAPGHCPKCGMKLLPFRQSASESGHSIHHAGMDMHRRHEGSDQVGHTGNDESAHHDADHGQREHKQHGHHHHAEQVPKPQHTEHEADQNHSHHGHERLEDSRGIEWEDDMVDVNRMTTQANMRWKIIDRATGAVGHAIDWEFRVGDKVKVRLVNEMDSDHPMHHPFHIHGAGRFVVLAREGVPESNLVWKDTVLVRTGQTVDILLDVTNPGLWMAHCHIAEHHESGMMFSFRVAE
jgi:FtsP/CotA-like multicopper oxidase with cupredoxin domain